ncbi:glutathione S-transferase [Ephemerocybe angulata]|uniref:glutathione transferase n=1 Tax=Ephemerocybe angulata TaxID=980116 RepID=A0A8H6HKH6_9AGAR|nr:glutathione S-transferase [Tulosesus angulatus]
MVLTLYGNSLSTCAKRVGQVLLEKQVPFQVVEVDLSKRENRTLEYLSKQPFGQVPYLDDDGYIIYESRAISRYIAEKYADQGTPLIPTELKAKGLFEQAASIEQSNFDAYANPAVYEMIIKGYLGLPRDKGYFDKLIAQLEPRLDVYDEILSRQRYLAGDELTLADLFHLPYGVLLVEAGSNAMEVRPNVARWFRELVERPSWQAVKDGVKSTA